MGILRRGDAKFMSGFLKWYWGSRESQDLLYVHSLACRVGRIYIWSCDLHATGRIGFGVPQRDSETNVELERVRILYCHEISIVTVFIFGASTCSRGLYRDKENVSFLGYVFWPNHALSHSRIRTLLFTNGLSYRGINKLVSSHSRMLC
jgi:hypothetical protein